MADKRNVAFYAENAQTGEDYQSGIDDTNTGFYQAGQSLESWKDWSFDAATYWLRAQSGEPSEHPTLGGAIKTGAAFIDTDDFALKVFNGTSWVSDLDTDKSINGTWTFSVMPQVISGVTNYPIVPPGGSVGQTLSKVDGDDYNLQWTDPPSGSFDPTFNYTITGDWTFSQPITGTATGNLVSTDIANMAEVNANETISGNWIFNGTANFRARAYFEAEPRLDNNVQLQGINVAGTQNIPLVSFDNLDRSVFGSSSFPTIINGQGVTLTNSGVSVVQTASRAAGSLKIADSLGALGNVAAVHKDQTFTGANTFDNMPFVGGYQIIPSGGTVGQILTKVDATDYNTNWTTPSGTGFDPGVNYTVTGAWTFTGVQTFSQTIVGTTDGNLTSADIANVAETNANETVTGNWNFTGAFSLGGTQVTKSAADINDAAVRSGNNVFSGSNTFTGESTSNARINLANAIPIAGLDTVGTPRNIASISGSNNVEFGNTSLDLHLHYSGAQGHYFYHGGAGSINRVFQTDSRANGSLKIADSGGTFGNVAAVHKNNNFQVNQDFNNNIQVAGQTRIVGGSAATPSLVFTSDQDTGLYRKASGQMSFSSNGVEEVRFVERAGGSLQIADSGGVFGNVAAVHKAQTFTANQIMNTTLTLENNRAINMKESSGTERTMLFVSGSNAFNCGSDSLPSVFKGSNISLQHFGTTSVFTETRDNGSLKIYDRVGTAKKAGFRNPTLLDLDASGTYVLNQDYEGQILKVNNVGITIQAEQLEEGTVIRIRTGGIGCNLNAGTDVVFRWIDGGTGLTGNRVISEWSFVELVWVAFNSVDIVGNGIA